MKTNVEQKNIGAQVVPMSGNQCLWMKTGVVNFKACENAFECTSCTFDKEISRKLAQTPTGLISWREVMRQPHLDKECRHMLTGRVLFKFCSHNYQCQDCAYDQLLEEYDQDLSGYSVGQDNQVAGFMVPRLSHDCSVEPNMAILR